MRRLLVSLVVVGMSCAHAPVETAAPDWKLLSATPNAEEIQFQTSDGMNRATVTHRGARGPFVDLERTSGALRGTVRSDWFVDLRDQGNEIGGRFARHSYALTLRSEGDETRATGLVRGQETTFWMSPRKIHGTVGECRFDLVWGAGRYSGSRTCGPLGQETVSMLVPAALATWSDPESAALLTMIVSRF